MAGVNYVRRKKAMILAAAFVLLALLFVLTACNNDSGVYDVSGDSVSEPTHFMAKFMLILDKSIGASFGWTVVVFTIILRLILSPLDIWQKMIARKNSKAMERMKPQLEVLQEKYKNDKERYQQEQMALYKKEKYSMMGACLPTLVTFVVFFVVFAGFRQMVGYQWAQDYKGCYDTFETAMTKALGDNYADEMDKTPETYNKYKTAVENAQQEVAKYYNSDVQKDKRGFLWIHSIFVSDTWKPAVPDYQTVTGQSGFATSKLTGVQIDEYNLVMGKTLGTGGWGKGGKWNGWLLLPILSIVLSFLSTKLLSSSQGTPPPMPAGEDGKKKDGMQGSMKMMQYTMPVLMGVFAIMYSGAFALYMFTSSLTAILFQLSFNLIAKLVDKSREQRA